MYGALPRIAVATVTETGGFAGVAGLVQAAKDNSKTTAFHGLRGFSGLICADKKWGVLQRRAVENIIIYGLPGEAGDSEMLGSPRVPRTPASWDSWASEAYQVQRLRTDWALASASAL